jgi:Xaa-Pro aminopeptidase
MVVSNEPGYYEDGNFGVRIENLVSIEYVKPEHNEEKIDDSPNGTAVSSSEKKFLKFSKLTMIPIQKSLINFELLTSEEVAWLNEYHADVYSKVSPLLESDSPALEWLTKMCQSVD